MNRLLKNALIGMCFISMSTLAATSAQAIDRFVATTGNDNAGSNNCSDANNPCLTVANAVLNTQTGDRVSIAAGTYPEVEMIVSGRSITITGAGAKTTIIDGQNNNRLFSILADGQADISKLTLQNGDTGGGSQDEGGAIRNLGVLKLSSCVVKNNGVQSNNVSHGGAIFNGRQPPETQGGIAEIKDCTISGNSALVRGGAISNGGGEPDDFVGTLTLTNSTITGNTSGLASASQLGGGGGGVFNNAGSTLSLFNVTVAKNTANQTDQGDNGGGGLHSKVGGTATINNSLIADNADNSTANAEDCFGNLASSFGHNLVETLTGCTLSSNSSGNVTGLDPLLASLADNGGDTPTQALQSQSPAIDAGDPSGCKDATGVTLTADQRGSPRPEAGIEDGTAICDIGSYEAAAGTTPTPNHGGNGASGGCSFASTGIAGGNSLAGCLLVLGNLSLLGWFRRRA